MTSLPTNKQANFVIPSGYCPSCSHTKFLTTLCALSIISTASADYTLPDGSSVALPTEFGDVGNDAAIPVYYKWDGSIVSDPADADFVYYADKNGSVRNTSPSGTVSTHYHKLQTTSASALKGGAVSNSGAGVSLIGDYVSNSINGNYVYSPYGGGALYNEGTITSIGAMADRNAFIFNRISINEGVNSMLGSAYGGAIYNIKSIDSIYSVFIDNSVDHIIVSQDIYTGSVAGGAIYNQGTITTLDSIFVGNHARGATLVTGGAVANAGTITNLGGEFIGNFATTLTDNAHAHGGAIVNGSLATRGGGNNIFICKL